MANIYQLAATGLPTLGNIIKTYRSTPVLGGVEGSNKVVNAIFGSTNLGTGVPIKAETYEEHAPSDVSQQMIMASDGLKKWVSDNVAPQPRSWDITGYLTTTLLTTVLGTGFLASFYINNLKNKLLAMRNTRKPVKFKTVDNDIVDVAIVTLDFGPTAEAGNALPVTLKLQEVPYLTVSVTTESTKDAINAIPSSGSAAGQSMYAGASLPAL